MKMIIPKHNFWIKAKAHEVTEQIKSIGCQIVKENKTTLEIEVPDTWYFTTDNQTYLTAFSDKNRTNAIFTVKERINTGTSQTYIVKN